MVAHQWAITKPPCKEEEKPLWECFGELEEARKSGVFENETTSEDKERDTPKAIEQDPWKSTVTIQLLDRILSLEDENFELKIRLEDNEKSQEDFLKTNKICRILVGHEDSKAPPTKKETIIRLSNNCSPTPVEIQFKNRCIFCLGFNHKSVDCEVYSDCSEREEKLISDTRCTKCLDSVFGMMIRKCSRERVACSNCVFYASEELKFHHPWICQFNDRGAFREMRRREANRSKALLLLPPLFDPTT